MEINSNIKTVLVTVLATSGLIALLVATYALGTRSNRTEQVTVQPAETPTISTNMQPAATNQVANAANTVANNVNNAVNNMIAIAGSTPRIREKPAPESKRTLSEAFSGDWVYVTETADSPGGFYYFYKALSVKKTSDGVEVWVRRYPMFPMKFARREELTIPVDYALEKLKFYCDNGTFHTESETYFDADGSSIPHDRSYRYQDVAPGTVTESMAKKVCSIE